MAGRPSSTAIQALGIPDYRRYWLASGLTGFGLNFWFLGAAWVVLELTDSALQVGLLNGLAAAPSILLSLVGGALTDRIDRRRMLVGARLAWAAACLVTALLVSSGRIEAWQVLATAAVIGVADAASTPAWHTLLVDIVGKSRLVVTNALAQVAEFGGELVAPLAAGIVIASRGSGPVFYLAAGLLFAAALLMARIRARADGPVTEDATVAPRGLLSDIGAGLAYTLHTRPFPGLLALSSLSLLSAAVLPLVPVYARDVLEVGPGGFGVMAAALATGMLGGAFAMAAVGDVGRPGLVILGARVIWFAAMAGFAVSGVFPLSVALLVVMGVAGAVTNNLILTQFQVHAEDRMRGRVMSIQRIAESLDPLGAVVGGALASMVGGEAALLLCAAAGVVGLGGIMVAWPEVHRG